MWSVELFASFFVAVCTGPYCGPDSDYERPAGPLLGNAAAPVLAATAAGTCYLAWESRSVGESDVFFNRRSPGAGGSWLDTPVRLDAGDPGSNRSIEVRLVAGTAGRVGVLWQEDRAGVEELLFRASEDSGLTWSEAATITGKPAGASLSSMASLACGPDDALLAAWEDRRNGERDVYAAFSRDWGRTWSEPARLDEDPAGSAPSYHPQVVALEDGTALVVWWDESTGAAGLFARRSADGGTSWSAARRLDESEEGFASHDAVMSTAGLEVVVVWERVGPRGETTIQARTSADGGVTWGDLVECGSGRDPVVAASARDVSVGWARSNPSPGGRTSIAGRVMDVPGTIGFWTLTLRPLGSVTRVSELYGPCVQAMGADADGSWFVGTGTASGKAVVEARRIGYGGRWETGAVLLFGGNGPLGYVPTAVRSVRVAGSADGGVHVVWVSDVDDTGELGYQRLARPALGGPR